MHAQLPTSTSGMWSAQAAKALSDADLKTATFADVKSQMPPLNLPAHIAFPSSVAQLVGHVRKALEMNVGISVKTSGHR